MEKKSGFRKTHKKDIPDAFAVKLAGFALERTVLDLRLPEKRLNTALDQAANMHGAFWGVCGALPATCIGRLQQMCT